MTTSDWYKGDYFTEYGVLSMQKLDELDSQVAQIIKKLELEFRDVVTYKVSSNPSNGCT